MTAEIHTFTHSLNDIELEGGVRCSFDVDVDAAFDEGRWRIQDFQIIRLRWSGQLWKYPDPENPKVEAAKVQQLLVNWIESQEDKCLIELLDAMPR